MHGTKGDMSVNLSDKKRHPSGDIGQGNAGTKRIRRHRFNSFKEQVKEVGLFVESN